MPKNQILQGLDAGKAVDFLRLLRPDGPWLLAAIPTDGGAPTCAAYDGRTAAYVADWIEPKNKARRGIYYHINETRAGLGKKADKADVTAVEFIHVDLDPDKSKPLAEEQARLRELTSTGWPEGLPLPTFTVWSGGGVQLLWRLAEKLPPERFAEAEAASSAMADALGGDATHNIDRLFRLPGTVNWPDAKKTAHGRTPVLAELLNHDASRVYPLDAFPKLTAKRPSPLAKGQGAIPVDASAILRRFDLAPDALDLITNGAPEGKRSDAIWRVMCELVSKAATLDEATALLTCLDLPISAKVLEQAQPANWLKPQWERAFHKVLIDSDFLRSKAGAVLGGDQLNFRKAVARSSILLAHNEFTGRACLDNGGGLRELGDADLDAMRSDFAARFGFRISKELLRTYTTAEAKGAPFHPVRDKLAALEATWDGKARLDTWLPRYAQADDTPYTRAVGALVLIAAVRRVRRPGVKFDTAMILEGKQGCGKSSLVRILALEDAWFSDSLKMSSDPKTVIENTCGAWILELAELQGRAHEVEAVKAFLSASTDRARVAYASVASAVPRQFICVGTTNSTAYLKDSTGARRFLPIAVGQIDLDALRADIGQLYGEAAAREAKGEAITLPEHLWAVQAELTEARTLQHPYAETMQDQFGEAQGYITMADLYDMLGVRHRQAQDAQAVRDSAASLGFTRRKVRLGGKPVWAMVRGEAMTDLNEMM
ncbi:VapE domain-containing protein [Glycocaulis sp.]|uniref:VapE domain-containing protein n=1 Tax=Glycocaulis sp. TaxID=1969725 RepID=UPI003D1FAE23